MTRLPCWVVVRMRRQVGIGYGSERAVKDVVMASRVVCKAKE